MCLKLFFIDDLLYELKKTQKSDGYLIRRIRRCRRSGYFRRPLEEIVGEIDDESDEAEELYEQVSDPEYIIQGEC